MSNLRVVIVDYNVGNTLSVRNAIASLGYRKLKVSASGRDIMEADALVLPGVGAFEACAKNLKERALDTILHEAVIVRRTPILGICVGMQIMADASDENGRHPGLGWIPGEVTRIEAHDSRAVPHVGWNNITIQSDSALFSRISESANFYFDHSYEYLGSNDFISATCDYSGSVTAAIQRDHIFGVQFHPEKSQTNGLKLFRSFFEDTRIC